MKQEMRVSPERLEVGLEGKQRQVGTAPVGNGRGGNRNPASMSTRLPRSVKLLPP